MEVNRERMEAIAEHYEGEPCTIATYRLTNLQGWACEVV
jgi:hypothetical protein